MSVNRSPPPPPPPPDLHALQHVQEVVHARQVLDVLEDGDQQGGSDGEGAGQQHSSETRPAQVQETLRAERKASVCDILRGSRTSSRLFQRSEEPRVMTSDHRQEVKPDSTQKILM